MKEKSGTASTSFSSQNTAPPQPPNDSPLFHQGRSFIRVWDDAKRMEHIEEREEEEYLFVHHPCHPPSEASDSMTISFSIDDRVPPAAEGLGPYEYIEEEEETLEIVETHQQVMNPQASPQLLPLKKHPTKFKPFIANGCQHSSIGRDRHCHSSREMASRVSASSPSITSYARRDDFHRTRALIEEASRNPAPPPGTTPAPSDQSRVQVRQVGDTTVVTEHRDPYSFYWQLDRVKRAEKPRSQRLPPADYIIDEIEEEEEDEEGGEEKAAGYEHYPQTVLSPDSHDSGINEERTESHYSRPFRREEPRQELPAGWERHEDPSGFSYYWHVDSGRVQREVPVAVQRQPTPIGRQISVGEQIPARPDSIPQQPQIIEEHAYREVTTKRCIKSQDESDDIGKDSPPVRVTRKPARFMVRSLGNVEVAEDLLRSADEGSQTIDRAIEQVTTSQGTNTAGIINTWAGGRELVMELDSSHLSLRDPEDGMRVIHSEPIERIRLWGMSSKNARDFAYVARSVREKIGGSRFFCNVFRCDNPARIIANVLQDICNRRVASSQKPLTLGSTPRRVLKKFPSLISAVETQRVVRCYFVGVTQVDGQLKVALHLPHYYYTSLKHVRVEVPRATGIHLLNEAVDRLLSQAADVDKWLLVDVAIAPSEITIRELNGNLIANCRVRYLSFLGVARDIKYCAFIMRTSTDNFLCYVFRVEPSAGSIAKMIEAACKLRYQKVLDAHLHDHDS